MQRRFYYFDNCLVDWDGQVDAEGSICSDKDMKENCTGFIIKEDEVDYLSSQEPELSTWEQKEIINRCMSSEASNNIPLPYRDRLKAGDIKEIASDFIDFLGLSWDKGMEKAVEDFKSGMEEG